MSTSTTKLAGIAFIALALALGGCSDKADSPLVLPDGGVIPGDGSGGPPDPTDAVLPDWTEFDYVFGHIFSMDDVLGDFEGNTYADDPSIICETCEIYDRSPAGVDMVPIDSAFGFNVRDFVGLEQKTRDGIHEEGWVGQILTDDGQPGGLALASVPTDSWRSGSPLGSWCGGLGGSLVKCSTENYVVMEHVLTCTERIPYYFNDPVTGAPVDPDYEACVALDDVLTPAIDTILPSEHDLMQMAIGPDYSVSMKDDGKFLYRWGQYIKSPTDVRLNARIRLPAEWMDPGADFVVTRAQLAVVHTITNNPNDQIRPEDLENEGAHGRLPGYIVSPDGYWLSDRDCYQANGVFLPAGTVLRNPAYGTPQTDPPSLSEDLVEGFTNAWYTTIDRDPFEGDPITGIGPRWRLLANKFGQNIPGYEIPEAECTQPPVQHGEERYTTGELTTTLLNLLDWDPAEGESPLLRSTGWIAQGEPTVNGASVSEDLDLAIYVKGDQKPVYLFAAILYLDYEPAPVF